jgi:YidC/Oxa1 family membrane protein insertase
MGTDRNTIIGYVLLGILLLSYIFLSTKNGQELAKQKKIYDDSVAMAQVRKDSIVRQADTIKTRMAVSSDTSGFNKAIGGVEHELTVENDVLKIVFTNKGAQPKEVELKKFSSFDSTAVKIIDSSSNTRVSYPVNISSNQSSQITDLYFDEGQVAKNADGSQTVSFRLPAPGGESIIHQYRIPASGYLIDWNVVINNADKLFSQNDFNLLWHVQLNRIQKNIVYEKRLCNICFYEDENFDYISSHTDKKFEKPVQWIAVSQQFFNTTLIAKNNFNSGNVHWARDATDSSTVLGNSDASFQSKIPAGNSATIAFQFFYGPNDYHTLKSQAPGMDRIVNLGRDFYSFVRPVNVYIIMPVFDFLKKFTANYGIVIMLLTIFIRLLTSPLVYTSYLSGAKMKALKPEIDALKKRLNNDQQQVAVEQMKLFRESGVNQFGGCIPALLQIPIFFALYSFFNSNVELRSQHFLWSSDLSAFDSIASIPNIPLIGSIYGTHVSLFGLLAVATSFLITLYGMSLTPDQSNPTMKYMPYIMPVMLLFFFNNLPSALTWYYTVSNLITLLLQWVIQTYIIDHDKIIAQLAENRKKPKAKSKWQERMEQMQESQKKVQQLKNKK